MAINVTIDGTLYEDVEVITVGGKTLLLAYSADSGSGDNGSGDSGGDTGGDTEAVLPMDGLKAFFDLRGATAAKVGTAYGFDKATIGDGGLYCWQQTGADNYGTGNNLWYTESTTTEFTFATISYDAEGSGVSVFEGYGALSNSVLCTHSPKYNNTSGGTAGVGSVNSKHNRIAGWHTYVLVVNGTKLDIYVDGLLDASFDGTDYEDFASWVSIVKNANTRPGIAKTAAYALYNKALSEVEVVELIEYLKTLEVA